MDRKHVAGSRSSLTPGSAFALQLAALITIVAGHLATAQTALQEPAPRGALRGIVLDPAHAPVAGARVMTTLDGPDPVASGVSDQNGEFSLSLVPGDYT